MAVEDGCGSVGGVSTPEFEGARTQELPFKARPGVCGHLRAFSGIYGQMNHSPTRLSARKCPETPAQGICGHFGASAGIWRFSSWSDLFQHGTKGVRIH